jgi:hypothetical protein
VFCDTEVDDHFSESLHLGVNSLVYMFHDQGIMIKMALSCEMSTKTNQKHLRKWEKIFGTDGQAIPLKKKQFGREFLGNDRIFDALYLAQSKNSFYRLRNPLTVMVDYKGFRALVIAVIPIRPESGLSLGFDADGHF